MNTCTRRGCGKPFDPASNHTSDCVFHPGQPVFHEGLKSWSCCRDKNKPVMEFDHFMKLEGCATGTHSIEQTVDTPASSAVYQKPESTVHLAKSLDENGRETYSTSNQENLASTEPNPCHPKTTSDVFQPIRSEDAVKAKSPVKDPEDDEEAIIPSGAKCKRLSCGLTWSGPHNAKRGKLDTGECTYHPGTPIFHEGSKGYSCCKRRVLDFDDFMKIKGCKTGSHLFHGSEHQSSDQEELVNCRYDFYQTPSSVIVNVFGKNSTKDTSFVNFETQAFEVDLKLPSNKRFSKKFTLFGTIDPQKSSYKILSTKCEIELFKSDGRSWSNLEKDDAFSGTVTFGVGGRTGTVGAKHIVT